MNNTKNEQSSCLLKEYLDWKYKEISSGCNDSTNRILKWLAELAETSEK